MASLAIEGNACTIENDLLAVRFSEDGKATSVVYDGRELLKNLSGAAGDPDREHCFYCDYHVNGKTRNLVPTRLEVIEDTPERVHVAYVDDESALKLAYHLVVLEGEPAVYGYVVAACDESEVTINELRTVYRFDSSLFLTGYTGRRQGLQPQAEYMAAVGEKLQDETFRFADACRYTNSDVYSKYDYAGYFADNDLWGQYSGDRTDDEWGAWFIPLDKSCYPGGPLKQELLVHYDGIILNYMTGAHFGTGDFDVPEGWRKLYGPWCVYFNHGCGVVADAQKRAAAERAALPAAWLPDSELYTSSYASLSGTLALATPVEHPRGLTVVAASEPGDYFEQKAGRIYYATAEDGRFELSRMQPGRYWLHARLNATSDEHEYDLGCFEVAPGEARELGVLSVDNRPLPVVWQLGYATGTTEPFAFWDQPRNYVWMSMTPKNLTWRAGSDDTWYYLQRAGGTWSITFPRPVDGADRYVLTVCLAGATAGTMVSGRADVGFAVSLNGALLRDCSFENDRAAYRSSVTGGHGQTVRVEIPAADLADDNTVSFETTGYVMYDMVKLEAEVDA